MYLHFDRYLFSSVMESSQLQFLDTLQIHINNTNQLSVMLHSI